MGALPEVFLHVLREVYRVCMPGATIQVNAPHPRHDHFLMDPTHVRPLTPELFSLFDLEQNQDWIRRGAANTPLAIYSQINFRTIGVKLIVDHNYQTRIEDGSLSKAALKQLIAEHNNVVQEVQITLRAVK